MLQNNYNAVLATIIVLWLPGIALEQVLALMSNDRFRFVDSIALSIAITALLAFLLSNIGFVVTHRDLVKFYLFCALTAAFCQGLNFLRKYPGMSQLAPESGVRITSVTSILLVLFGGVLALRLFQIRELVLPNWVDSLHHTLIVQILREQGAIPDVITAFGSAPFFYHFGFHVVTAIFAELTGWSSAQAVLIFGQILNALIVLVVYRLVMSITRHEHVGITAALFTGFISQMPAYYVSWGRYTLLTGMILLPVAMSSALELWHSPLDWRHGVRFSVLTAGLCFTHYIAAAMFACFLLALVLYFSIGSKVKGYFSSCLVLIGWGSISMIVVGGWISRVFKFASPKAVLRSDTLATFPPPEHLTYWWHLINRPRSWLLIGLAAVALTVFRRRQVTGLMAVWLLVMAALFTEWPWQIRPFRPDLLLICAFLPINVMASTSLHSLLRRLALVLKPGAAFSLLPTIWIVLIAWGVMDTATIVNPQTILVTAADIEAISWVTHNTPADARFLINVAPWQYGIYRGTDGGWWIPLLSDRQTILPPGIQYDQGNYDYKTVVADIAEEVLALEGCEKDFWQFVVKHNITHIYIGARGGPLKSQWFDQCQGVQRIYMGLNVHIYRIE